MKIIAILILALSTLQLSAQVPSSLSISPYSGVDRIHLNPALGIQSSYNWDLSLVGGHVTAFTDYTFLRKASLLNFANRYNSSQIVDAQNAIPEQSDIPLIIFDENRGKKKLYLRGRVNGPSFSINLNPELRVGVFSNFRVHASSSDIPENFGIYELNESYQTNIIDVDRGSFAAASWMEIGAHFSRKIENGSFGFNIKMLRAHEGGYVKSDIDADFQFLDSIVAVNGITNFEVAFTNGSLNSESLQTNFNGGGIGIDLGLNYELESLSFGLSLMDIGVLQFKSNVEIYTPEILSGIVDIRTQDFRGFTSVRDLLDQFQNDLNVIPDQFGVFSVGLPTRISLFADYTYDQKISISANLNQRLPIFPNSLKSNNTLVLTPRYENALFAFFMPVTIYEYRALRIGTAFRIGPLTIGSDHITSVLFPHDFKGSDIFFSLNIFPFGKEGSSRSRGGTNGVFCPEF